MSSNLLETIVTARREGWTSLSLHQQGITELPPEIGEITTLEHLSLSGNRLTELPDSLCNLSNLHILDLYGNRLTRLPSNFGELTQLRAISLPHNQLTALPRSFGSLRNLEGLSLRNNQLTALPEEFTNLSGLTRLDLSDNDLRTLPEGIGNLFRLENLEVKRNLLTTLPDSIGNLASLRVLSVDDNQLAELPDCISGLTKLFTLTVDNNRLKELPHWISDLMQDHALRHVISLGGNLFTELPSWTWILFDLRLENSPLLTTLPLTIRVVNLHISGCKQLSYLPDGIIVTNRIWLADTALRELPLSLQNTHLSWHDVSISYQAAFHPETLTIEDIQNEQDMESRWVMLERLNNPAVKVTLLDTEENDDFECGLYCLEQPGHDPFVYFSLNVKIISIPYLVRVPSNIISCQQANAWMSTCDGVIDYCPE